MRFLLRDLTNGLGPVTVTEDERVAYEAENIGHDVVCEAIFGAEDSKAEKPDYYIREINTVDGRKALIEVWDIFEAFQLSVPKSFAAKYILRAGKKDVTKEIEDLKKAIKCLEREIKELERSKE